MGIDDMQHLNEDELILYYYGEAGSDSAPAHLEACAACREAYQSLQRVLNSVASAPVPDRGAGYGPAVWRRLQARLPELKRRRERWALWSGWAAAAAATVVAAFFAGTYFERSHHPALPQVAMELAATGTDPRMLQVALGHHLKTSLLLMTELQNASGGGAATDIRWQRQTAERLLGDNRLYKLTASSARAQKVERLLADLEELLLEIAHSPEEIDAAQLDQLQRRIDRKGIVFEMRVTAAEPALAGGIL